MTEEQMEALLSTIKRNYGSGFPMNERGELIRWSDWLQSKIAPELAATVSRLEARVAVMEGALKLVRFNWAGHSEVCAVIHTRRAGDPSRGKCDCKWPKIAAQIDAALSPVESEGEG